jgi:serine/threonine protein kinase
MTQPGASCAWPRDIFKIRSAIFIVSSYDDIGWEDSLGDIASPGDVVAGKYRIDKIIGSGGMGIVVEAWHMHFEERVAIKFLLPHMGANDEARERFEREARAAFKIKSEHVARVIDVGKLDGDVPYMVMEHLAGTDLGVMLTDRRGVPIEAAVEYVLQACEAVAEAHALGIVHRDLKPENLFLVKRADGTPCIKVLDFGLSKMSGQKGAQRERALTATSQVMGTPQYMSPEQWMSAKDVGPHADQWALGVILYELVTGAQPFDEDTLAQLCTQVLRGDPEPLAKLRPDAPAGLERVILRALSKDKEDRYANVGQFALDLHHYGPARARASARRIAGVFNRAGVDVGDIPESLRPRGLGLGLMLGQTPPPGTQLPHPRDEIDSDDDDESFDYGAPTRARQVDPRLVQDSKTELMPHPALTNDQLSSPMQPPIERSGEWQRQHGVQSPPLGPSSDASSSGPSSSPQGDPLFASGEHTALLESGQYALPSDSGRYALPDDSGRFQMAPGTPQHGTPHLNMPEATHGLAPRRAVTAQSWQNVMAPQDTSRRKVAAVVSSVLLVTVIAVALLVGAPTETASENIDDPRPAIAGEAVDNNADGDATADDVAEAPSGDAGGDAGENAGDHADEVRDGDHENVASAGRRRPAAPKPSASAKVNAVPRSPKPDLPPSDMYDRR